MSKSAIFLSILALTPLFSFLSELLEYTGYEFMWAGAICGLLSIAGTIALIVVGARLSRATRPSYMAVTVLIAAASPFLVSKALSDHETPFNAHGLAILTFLLYASITEVAAIVSLIALSVRAWRERQTV